MLKFILFLINLLLLQINTNELYLFDLNISNIITVSCIFILLNVKILVIMIHLLYIL